MTSEAIPVKLPAPPSTPDSVAARALAALNDGPSSLDVHLRWSVESGSIVQRGETIAQLYYAFRGSPPPPPGVAAKSNTIIRAKKKKRWGAAPASAAELASRKMPPSSAATSSDDYFVPLTLKSNTNGILKILYTKPLATNAVRINEASAPKYAVVNLILAAIEPCEHPAVVDGLCAVCGADTRAPKDSCAPVGEPTHIPNVSRKQNQENPVIDLTTSHSVSRQAKIPANSRQKNIIEKQKQLAASIASASNECDSENDDEFANFDMDAAIASMHQKQPATNNTAIATKPIPAIPKVNKTAAPPKAMRSLSSLLSGAKATQKMQLTPPKQNQPPQNRHMAAASRRPRQAAMHSSTNNSSLTTADDKMSKVTVSGGVTITISESEAKNISDLSSKKLREEKKLCLVLDLDHTLLHATDDFRAGRFVADEVVDKSVNHSKDNGKGGEPATKPNTMKRSDVRSILLPVELPPDQQQMYVQQKMQQQKLDETHFCLSPLPQQKQNANSSIIMRHFVKLRPNLKEFFSNIESTYQLSVYTAGTRAYAEQVAIMICRHLVGASLDEEGLNSLRAKVREIDAQCRKYRAKMERKEQLEMAQNWGTEEEDDGGDRSRSAPKKAVSFGEDVEEGTVEGNGGKAAVSKDKDASVNATENGRKKSEDATNDSKCASASSLKRDQATTGDATQHIPRKKKRANNAGSLLTNLVAETESDKKKKDGEKAQEEPVDPTPDRDRLRKELEEAEELEIKAVELRRKMFGSRIVSRTDVGDLGKDVKCLKRVFPCGGVMAAILDDREDVWANAKSNATGRPGEPPDNLLLVKPYHWKPFEGYADVNNASGNDLSKTNGTLTSENNKGSGNEDDMQLLWTADILRRLHERYYSTSVSEEERERLTVPSLLQSMRRETLLRFPQVKVVFSGLIPIHKQNKQEQVRPTVVRYAEELGAEVLNKISNEVTHVVANKDGTEKIKQARKNVPGCYIVHASWLMECFWSISRRDVLSHHMGPLPSSQQKSRSKASSTKGNPLLLSDRSEEESDYADEEDDDDDDDFAADLENEMMVEN